MTVVLRLLVGSALAWCVGVGLLAPETPLRADLAVLLVVALTAWRPAYGIAAVIILAAAGLLLAAPPTRESELLTWAFIATCLLRVRPTGATRAAGGGLPPEVQTPARLFAACVVASWLGITIAGAAGIEPGAVPLLLAHTIRADHLLFSSPEPDTSAMLQLLAGLSLFAAAARVSRFDADTRRITVWALVACGVLLAAATIGDVARQWAHEGYGGWFLWRYVRGERFSLHLTDLNAAGSQYVLAGLAAAALATADRGRRWFWIAAIVVILPALWLTGSRSAAIGAILVGTSVIPLARQGLNVVTAPAHALIVALLALAIAGATIVAARQPAEQGTAASALSLRSQFLVTSARMFASAPVFGVGVGHYHERSAAFMPLSLREVYPFENAHNYFAQQFAELGVVGGLLFLWLVAAGVRAAWKGLAESGGEDAPLLALVTGCVAYLLTCVTGHPLLVSEAALPFWAAFGVAAASPVAPSIAASDAPSAVASASRRTILAAVVMLMLMLGIGLQARRYAGASATPTEQGFHELETGDDGRRFNWMTRHGVFYIGAQPGFLVVPVRAPELPRQRDRPFMVDVEVGGRRMGSHYVPSDHWTDIRIGLRDHARLQFRRVDLRVNQEWTRMRDLGSSTDATPRSIKVGAVRWEPAGSR